MLWFVSHLTIHCSMSMIISIKIEGIEVWQSLHSYNLMQPIRWKLDCNEARDCLVGICFIFSKSIYLSDKIKWKNADSAST